MCIIYYYLSGLDHNLNHIISHSSLYGDIVFAKTLSILNNTCRELSTNGYFFLYVHLMESKSV